ncbi:hypothetical protein PHYPSEUDO_003871 [Phytophthora pseudosyringae]|uniref:M96 mating-specific protein family n=1 Tax=Phytophthora pseudosyringae TaxID=221518 RepID=A0A8T1VPQ2_9STRA|nr:hypothetical protein PHYPSEUDO_003871 [Phytophthora pseudosyringae]
MALQLVEDDQVLEAVLSLLDRPDDDGGGDAMQLAPSKKKRGTRRYNPNRAREARRQELLTLRGQVPQLERRLEKLRRKVATPKGTDMATMWRRLAMHERKSKENAAEENRRLRALVRESAEVTHRNVQQLLQTGEENVEVCPHLADPRPEPELEPEPGPWPFRRIYAVPVDPRDDNIFQEMAQSIDMVHRQVLQMYSSDANRGGDVDAAQFSTTGEAHCRAFADKVLPYDVDSVGDAAWQFVAYSSRRPTTRFYYHTDAHEPSGLVSDDTVVEISGEEHRFGQVLLDVKVKQIVRRYVAAGRVVIAWRALLSPEKFKTETLSDVVYDEKGALVIEPFASTQERSANETASVVHTWQTVTPNIAPPGRAVQSMERTLRAQSAH